MGSILLPILPGTLTGFCFKNWQDTLVQFANNMQAVLDGCSFFNYGDTKPDPQYEAYPWLYSVDMQWYKFSGVWQRPHPYKPGEHRWEEFTQESDIWSFDGGDGSNPTTTPPSANAGAMWELDHNYDGRSPMSPGAITGSSPAKTLGFLEDYSSGAVTLTAAQLAAHYHGVGTDGQPGGGDPPVMLSKSWSVVTAITGRYEDTSGTQTWADGPAISSGTMGTTPPLADSTTTPDSVNVVHPVRGMCCIVRTARLNYVIP